MYRKTREERRAFLARIEKKYKEKLLLQQYKSESEELGRQKMALQRAKAAQEEDYDSELLDLSHFTPTYS